MSKKSELAKKIYELAGEKNNISNAYHCMTRLRIMFKDRGLVDVEGLNQTPGVMGTNMQGSEIQVIIGPAVDDVYKEFIKLSGLEETDKIDENLDAAQAPKEKNILKRGFNAIVDTFSACFSPIIPILILTGVVNLIAVVIGPTMLNLVSAESDLYTNFNWISQAFFYFIPMFLAYTSSRHFKTNTLLTMVIAAFMLYPSFTALVATEGASYTFFGIPVQMIDYSTSVLPMIMIPWIQSYVEKGINKICPDVLKVVLFPTLTALIMIPVALCAIGPIATLIGNALNSFLVWLYAVAGPLETTVLGAVAVLGVGMGFVRPIYFTGLMAWIANGVDFTTLPMLAVISNFIAMGATTAYLVKVRSGEKKQLAVSCLLSNALGGVSEPSIYGIFMVNRIMLLATVIGGAITGLVQGLLEIGYYQRGTSNIFGVLSFVSETDSSNFVKALIVCAVGFIVTFIISFILFKDKEEQN